MKLYNFLSRISFLKKSYSFKFLFIAFLGIHIPLLGLIATILFPHINTVPPYILVYVLVFTLIATAITCWAQNELVKPIHLLNTALTAYIKNKTLPTLPTQYTDEIGGLMHNLNTAIHTLDELLKEKRDFIYLLSHDLRNPLSNIIILTELIKQGPTSSAVPEYIQMIEKSSQAQLTLIRTVLSLAESEYAESDKFAQVKVKDVIEPCIADMEINSKIKGIKITTDIPDEHYINVNEASFKLLINNLLINAIKFSNYGGDIRICSAIEGDRIKINVMDNGIGLPDNSTDELFRAFTKMGREGTLGEESTGIGLYFCKKIVEHHNGSITAQSQGAGKGSNFTVILPLIS